MQRVTKLKHTSNVWKENDETGKCRTQIPSCDPYDSSPEFKQKRATKLRLNKARVNKAQSLDISNDFPIVSTSSQHRENVPKKVAEEESESRNFGTVVELGEVFEIEKRVCPGCSQPVAATTYNSHLHHCLKRFRSQSSIDQCPECKISLKRMSKVKKKEHIDRCQRLASESDSSSNSQSKEALLKILDCPFCGKYGENPQWRIGHMQKCAKSKHYTLKQYNEAIEIQEKHAKEKLAAGLPTGPARPVVAPRTTRLTRAITVPITYDQEDLQMAKAMSLSLEREERLQREQDDFVVQALSAETQSLDEALIRVLENQLPKDKLSRKKNKKKTCTPLLLLRSAEDRAKIIAERAAEMLSKASEFDLTTSAVYVNWKDVTIHRDWVSNLVHSRLWRLSSLANELTKDPKCFYTAAFLEYEDPNALGSYVWKHRRLSEIPGYKLPSRWSHEQSLPDIADSSSTLATQDVVAQLYIQNNEHLTSNVSDPRASETIMEEDEAMGDGFFTQINQQDLVSHSTLSNNLLEMVGSSKLSDVTIQVECELTIPCHRFMLLARCPAAYNELRKDEFGDQYILDWRAISYRGAMTFLKFIYAEIKPDVYVADDITTLARRYRIKELIVDGSEFESDEQRFSSNGHAVSDSSRDKMDGHYSSGSVKSPTTVDPPLLQPINISVLNIRDTEIDTYIDSLGSGSVSPVLFSSTPFESQTRIKTTINTSSKILPDLNQEKKMKVTEQIDIEYDTKSNLVNSKTQISLRPSLDESSAALSSPILSRSSNYDSETFRANMEGFLTPTQKTLTTSTPEIEAIKKRKSLDDDSECLLSLKKRIKMKSQALVKEVTTPTFDLDVENEEPNFTMFSPYAAAEFSPQLEFPSFNIKPSPVFNRVNKSDESPCHTDQIVLISPMIADPVKHSSSYESTPRSSCKRTQPQKKLNKRKEKVTLKKPVATPMPHYSMMETPEITKNLKSIGVRNLGKKKGVNLLKHVFTETRKKSATDEDESSLTSSPPKSTTSTASSPNKEKGLSEEGKNQIRAFLKKDESLYLSISQFGTVEIEELHKQILRAGLKFSLIQLKDFLDSECVSYKSAQVRRRQRVKRKSNSQ